MSDTGWFQKVSDPKAERAMEILRTALEIQFDMGEEMDARERAEEILRAVLEARLAPMIRNFEATEKVASSIAKSVTAFLDSEGLLVTTEKTHP